mmetsp:Transcript_53854/g.155492  ORF Transcript_53854/g.155492 Transcript_53854/m.155492 type:complete len:132 (+) Transcript_53854:63-458(+)
MPKNSNSVVHAADSSHGRTAKASNDFMKTRSWRTFYSDESFKMLHTTRQLCDLHTQLRPVINHPTNSQAATGGRVGITILQDKPASSQPTSLSQQTAPQQVPEAHGTAPQKPCRFMDPNNELAAVSRDCAA